MKMFENAQVGDKVYSRLHGEGEITKIYSTLDYPVECKFNIGDKQYDYSGRYLRSDIEPTLFYRTDTNNFHTDRPQLRVPWKDVPIDTKILVNEFPRYFARFANNKIIVYPNGTTSFSNQDAPYLTVNDSSMTIELAEDITIKGVFYPKGSK
jgi:hypothetical protein